jgi:CRP/FNR family transcriptional regulator, cyclic AMP receptor protein
MAGKATALAWAQKEDMVALLQNCVLFSRLDAEQLATLATRLKPISYKRNDIIFLKGEPGDNLYIIRKGRVKISVVNSAGKDLIINIYGAGEVFGEMSLFDRLPRSATASALDNVEAWVLGRAAFEQLLGEVPGLAANIIALLSRRLRYSTEQTEMLGLLDAYERVGLKLRQMAQEQVNAAGVACTINISQQELAAMLGLTREWLNKVLQTFADQNIIELNWGKIVVTDRAALEEWL